MYVSVYGDHPTEFYRPSDTNQVAHLTTHLLEQEGPVAGVNKYQGEKQTVRGHAGNVSAPRAEHTVLGGDLRRGGRDDSTTRSHGVR